MSRTAVILIGALLFALLTFMCITNKASDIQADIQARITNVLSNNTPTRWAAAKVDGRDVILTGVAPSEVLQQQTIDIVSDLAGVVDVDNQMTVASLESQLYPPISSNKAANEKIDEKNVVENGGSKIDSEPEQQQKNALEPDIMEPLDESQEVELEKAKPETQQSRVKSKPKIYCKSQFNQFVTTQTIAFSTNSFDIESQAKVVIYNLLQFADVCPDSIVEVAGHTDSKGNDAYNYRLSKQRAQSVVEMLIKNGIRADRLHMEGYGETKPISDNNSAQGQANNRRIELKYLREGEE